MVPISDLLKILNGLREKQGKNQLLGWKNSRQKLENEIAKLSEQTNQLIALETPTEELEVVKQEVKIPRGAINSMCIELLQSTLPYDHIVGQIKTKYPTAKTTPRSLASVAMDLRALGLTIPLRKSSRLKKDAA